MHHFIAFLVFNLNLLQIKVMLFLQHLVYSIVDLIQICPPTFSFSVLAL